MLAVLLAPYAGQTIHIYTEDPQHFAAFCGGDVQPSDVSDGEVVALHKVDNYYFFPYLTVVSVAHVFYSEALCVVTPAATSCKLAAELPSHSLRAPPVC